VYKVYGTLDLRVLSGKLERELSSEAGVPAASSEKHPAGVRPLALQNVVSNPRLDV
jgi:hypothetical protein